tara:strand:+ start:2931 stop:4301 length:1371 start_codon:yes stop_codon:yes gene_type:complete
MGKPDKYLSQRGYVIKKSSLSLCSINKLKKELSVSPFQIRGYGNTCPKVFQLYRENETKIYLPRYYGIDNFGIPDTNYLENHGNDIFVKFSGDIRENQKIPVNTMIDTLNTKGGGILNLRCGMGKTVCAIYIISIIKKKTLIIVHKEFLMNQWIERFTQFMPNAKIGIIQQNKVKVEDCDIVIGMLQSISMKTYDNNLFDSFGFTIVDECHHISSEVFSKALPKISTTYMMGLSATLDRKDGLRKVFEWYLGNPAISYREIDVGEVRVYVTELKDPKYQQASYNSFGKINLPKLINNIVESPNRMNLILDWMKLFSENNRKVLVLSERRQHLKNISKEADKIGLDCGFYWGGMKQEKLKESESKQFILGTYHMISEGFDLASLDTLIFASPKTDIVQASGRILRQGKNRPTIPIIVDIEDDMEYFHKKQKQRMTFYKKNDFKIFNIIDKPNVKLLV